MKHKILLLLAVALVAADILLPVADHLLDGRDYLRSLLAINAGFALYAACVGYLEYKRLRRQGKLPVSVDAPIPALQFSDQLLIRHFPDLLCLKDKDGRWLSASPEFLASYNLAGTDYFGKTDFDLAQHADCDVNMLQASAALDKKTWEQGAQNRTLRRISPELTLEVTRTPVFDLEQNRFRLIVTGKPADEFTQKRTRLECLEQALNGSHIAYALLDQDFHVLECNRAFSALTGFEPGELENKSIAMIIGRSEPSKSSGASFDVAVGQHSTRECECRHKDGRVFPARLEITGISSDEKKIYYFASLEDI
ncbi:MAG: PAS domain S-box protein, partial [Gammaproteobacteria bacterium]